MNILFLIIGGKYLIISLGYDLINMILKINSGYGKYFQFGLRNENKIQTNLLSESILFRL